VSDQVYWNNTVVIQASAGNQLQHLPETCVKELPCCKKFFSQMGTRKAPASSLSGCLPGLLMDSLQVAAHTTPAQNLAFISITRR